MQASLFGQASSPAICHSRQQLHCHLPRSGDCRGRRSHVATSPCLPPSGDAAKCRLTSLIRVRSVASKPYSSLSSPRLIVPHGSAIMFIWMFGSSRRGETLFPICQFMLSALTFPAALSVQMYKNEVENDSTSPRNVSGALLFVYSVCLALRAPT